MKPNDFDILDNMAEIVQIEDEEGILKYVNKAFCLCHGVTAEEAVGQSCFNFILPEDREACNVEKLVTPENPHYRTEGRAKRVDGKIIWIQYVGKAHFDSSGKLLEFQELGVDITKWKEKIEESAKELTRSTRWMKEIRSGSRESERYAYGNGQISERSRNFPAMHRFSDIYTANPEMKTLKAYAKAVAAGDATILIEGESGTGKELFAQAIHNASKRANGPFVAINCGVIPAELVGSELFGYAEGAFTGASKGGKAGKFEMASGGTLFLDEIGEMPLAQQVALLRVLETRTVSRIGDDKQIPVDVRIVCATNRDLYKEVENGKFRSDLYYRLNVINLSIPPLRERREDIHLLIGVLIKKYGNHRFKNRAIFDDKALEVFREYDWPGNVRELQNMMERLLYLPPEGVRGFMDTLAKRAQMDPKDIIRAEESEEVAISRLMREYEGNISMVARKLQISRNTLYKKLKQYDILY